MQSRPVVDGWIRLALPHEAGVQLAMSGPVRRHNKRVETRCDPLCPQWQRSGMQRSGMLIERSGRWRPGFGLKSDRRTFQGAEPRR